MKQVLSFSIGGMRFIIGVVVVVSALDSLVNYMCVGIDGEFSHFMRMRMQVQNKLNSYA